MEYHVKTPLGFEQIHLIVTILCRMINIIEPLKPIYSTTCFLQARRGTLLICLCNINVSPMGTILSACDSNQMLYGMVFFFF